MAQEPDNEEMREFAVDNIFSTRAGRQGLRLFTESVKELVAERL